MKNLNYILTSLMAVLLWVVCFVPQYGVEAGAGVSVALIPIVDMRPLYVNRFVAKVNEIVPAPSFFMSLFTSEVVRTKEISIEVRRGTEKIAVDVIRGTHGNYNKTSKSTMKTFLPPYFNEFFALNETDLYDQAMAMQTPEMFQRLATENSEDAMRIKNKILRAYERMCADVVQSGIVKLNSTTNIDFKRDPLSMVDLGAANYWDDPGVDPATSLQVAGEFMRNKGKVLSGSFDLICGTKAVQALMNNEFVQKRADIRRYNLDDLRSPLTNAAGGTYHGTISAGTYTFNIWSNQQTYTDAQGDTQNYMDPLSAVILPIQRNMIMRYALVPQLISDGRPPQEGEFVFQDYMDERNSVHEARIKSAGVPIPLLVDQMYTMQAVD